VAAPVGGLLVEPRRVRRCVGAAAEAGVLVVAGLIGGVFDFLFSAFGLWAEVISSRMFHWGELVADRFKLVAKLNVSAMVFGLGYIVGLRYSAIIAAGSFVSWFVLVPLFYEVGQSLQVTLGGTATKLIGQMSAEEIFRNYVRQIGIGGIAMAGIVGIIRSSKIIRRRSKSKRHILLSCQRLLGHHCVCSSTENSLVLFW